MATAVNLSLPLTSPFHIADKAIMPPCFKVIQIILTCVCLTLKRDVEICFQRRSILEKTEYPFNNIQNIERNVAELLYLGCMNQFMIDYKLITWSLCKQNPEKIDHIHAASERYDFVINYLHLYISKNQEFKGIYRGLEYVNLPALPRQNLFHTKRMYHEIRVVYLLEQHRDLLLGINVCH